MKALVIYDSIFGNTKQIAQKIGDTLGLELDVETLHVSNVNKNHIKGIDVAAFDTRITKEEIESSGSFIRFLVKRFGYAAEPIAEKLKKKGGKLIISPEGFFVEGTEGPLSDGELERAEDWARQIIKNYQ